MLLITCPVCNVTADETEFHYGGEAHIKRPASSNPANVSEEAQYEYLYVRNNPRGPHRELWQCSRGCGKWFYAMRDTLTLEFHGFYGITDQRPPLPATNTDVAGKGRRS